MVAIPFSSVEKNLSNGILIGEDFWFLRNTWDSLSPNAQYGIMEISKIWSQYTENAIQLASQDNENFMSHWREYILGLIKKQIQNLEKEELNTENSVALFSTI